MKPMNHSNTNMNPHTPNQPLKGEVLTGQGQGTPRAPQQPHNAGQKWNTTISNPRRDDTKKTPTIKTNDKKGFTGLK